MFHREIIKPKLQNNQSGSALVIAIFIIVIMTLLGSALMRMTSSSTETIAYEVIGTRALQAANAGAQKKLADVFPLLPNSGECTNSKYDFSAIEGLKNCDVINVDCSQDPTVDGIEYYTVTSTAVCSAASVYTSRKIEIKARSL